MTVRLADFNDIPALVKLRLDFFETEPELQLSQEQTHGVREQLVHYYGNHLNRDFYAALAEENVDIAAVSFLVVQEKPSNKRLLSGKTGLILNVLTYPEYRRQGLATRTLELLIAKAQEENVSYLELSATEAGAYVYRKLGFEKKESEVYTEMVLRLDS